jgi:hypothetical protein
LNPVPEYTHVAGRGSTHQPTDGLGRKRLEFVEVGRRREHDLYCCTAHFYFVAHSADVDARDHLPAVQIVVGDARSPFSPQGFPQQGGVTCAAIRPDERELRLPAYLTNCLALSRELITERLGQAL